MAELSHVTSNWALNRDYQLGLRGYGLIAYGALPASLGALGAFKAPDQASLRLSVLSMPFMIAVALVPVTLTFLQVRQRLLNWYEFRDHLLSRSVTITMAIVAASTVVCLATRALSKPDLAHAFQQWQRQSGIDRLNTIWHSLLLSFAYLVGSSTLFLTVIKEDSTLPLLPSKDQVAAIGALKQALASTARTADRFDVDGSKDELEAREKQAQAAIGSARSALETLRHFPLSFGRAALYEILADELDGLEVAVRNLPDAHNLYWSDPAPDNLNDDQLKARDSIKHHSAICGHV